MLRILTIAIAAFLLNNFSAQAGSLQSLQVRADGTKEQVILSFSTPVVLQKSFALASPPRVVLDIATATYDKERVNAFMSSYQGNAVAGFRAGQFDNDTTRFVFDLRSDTIRWEAGSTGNQLVIQFGGAAAASVPPPAVAAASSPSLQGKTVTGAPVPVMRSANAAKEARKPVIIIDAGHGGKDEGARSAGGIREKNVTLQYAKSLRDALLRTGRYKVALTREDDTYLFLKERVQVARTHKGDLFISIHADANPRSEAEGMSVYTLSETASDEEAAALAQQENKADIVGGLDLSHEDKTVADILIDLAQRETNNKSSRFAELVVTHMHPKVPLLSNTHRYAGFRVLKAPDIPSVLMEIGFLTNKNDVYRIQTREYRDKLVQGIVKAIDAQFGQ
jgi:N-acetylmuramoyl-L-alanine amidase